METRAMGDRFCMPGMPRLSLAQFMIAIGIVALYVTMAKARARGDLFETGALLLEMIALTVACMATYAALFLLATRSRTRLRGRRPTEGP